MKNFDDFILESNSEKLNILKQFVGKTVQMFSSGTKDKIIAFDTNYRRLWIDVLKENPPANPMGYSESEGIFTAVERNGWQKIVLQPSFAEELLNKLKK